MEKSSRRWRGYEEAMHAHGVENPEQYLIFTSFVFPYEIANLYLEPCLRKHRVRIPEDLSIVQWEYPLVSQILSPPRSTVCHDHRKVAEEAVALLYDMIRRKAPAREIYVPSTFLNRESIGPCRTRQDHTKGAANFLFFVQLALFSDFFLLSLDK